MGVRAQQPVTRSAHGPFPARRGRGCVACSRVPCVRQMTSLLVLLLSATAANMEPMPHNPVRLTVYHQYDPAYEHLGLANQNTGDIDGDLFFVMRDFMLPVECGSEPPSRFPEFDCRNPEQRGKKNVVAEREVVMNSEFGEYALCNEDVVRHTYTCVCGDYRHPSACNASVGEAAVANRYEHHVPATGEPPWRFWRFNLALKIGGRWFSTLQIGECTEESPPPCYWWLVRDVRRIAAACLTERISDAVRAYDPSCFESCPQPGNVSSICCAKCVMAVLLGPDGGQRVISRTEGMPIQLVLAAWQHAFDSPSKGGCSDAITSTLAVPSSNSMSAPTWRSTTPN